MKQTMGDRSPLSAAFIRGFMDESRESGLLRTCGEKGRESVEDLGLEISVAYISKLTKELEKLGLIQKARSGRHYKVTPGPRYDEFFSWLEDEAPDDWGETTIREDDFQDRLKAISLLESGGVDISVTNRTPRTAWSYLMSMFNRGDARVILVPSDAVVRVIVKDEMGKAKAQRVATWNK